MQGPRRIHADIERKRARPFSKGRAANAVNDVYESVHDKFSMLQARIGVQHTLDNERPGTGERYIGSF
jgi:hypothetical protein